MYKRYSILLTVLALAFGGYGIYWFIAADKAEAALPQTLARVLPDGLAIKYGEIERSGFPFRLIFSIHDLELDGNGGNHVATGLVDAVMQPTNLHHLIFRFAEPISYSIGDGTGGAYSGVITADRFLASAVSLGKSGGFRLDLDARDLRVERPGKDPLTAGRAQIHMRPSGRSGVYDLVLSGSDVAWGGFEVQKARSTGNLVYMADEAGGAPTLKVTGLSTASDGPASAETQLDGFLKSF